MHYYRKGFRAEREILRILSANGYSCLRSASSGGFLTPVDVIAIRSGRLLALEIKSWAKKPKLARDQLSRFSDWCSQAGAHGFLAWYNQNQWRFLPLKDVEEGRYEDENWIGLDVFLKVFL